MTKTADHLTFDFTGTGPQAGVINCTYAGMRGGVMLALLPILAGDIEPAAVARDLREQKITAAAAREMNGVVLVAGQVDEAATTADRDAHRTARKDRSTPPGKPTDPAAHPAPPPFHPPAPPP